MTLCEGGLDGEMPQIASAWLQERSFYSVGGLSGLLDLAPGVGKGDF